MPFLPLSKSNDMSFRSLNRLIILSMLQKVVETIRSIPITPKTGLLPIFILLKLLPSCINKGEVSSSSMSLLEESNRGLGSAALIRRIADTTVNSTIAVFLEVRNFQIRNIGIIPLPFL
jgi:hypothetical protein